ncbi:MAG: nucleoside hydrolase [Oceanospirillaceae bacterium]|nr:nucleoside hydrolase [Oceanospirillaceae bacterium]|tara:strand:- start:14256 stop:15383 length:1128 start_codon:yes stop_codon:yes gene_type:complete
MKRHSLLSIALFGLLFSLSANVSAAEKKIPVIFDTDMAIDDWAALLYLAHHPQADLIGVTVSSSGESHCLPGLNNIQKLLALSPQDHEVGIACGPDYPLQGYFVFPEAWRTDSDTLSGVPLPDAGPVITENPLPAEDLIHQLIQSATEKVTLIATGPLTNIALWLEKYPQDKPRIADLVIMGGAVDAPGNIIVPLFTKGHPNTSAEWNIFIDPLAADEVMKSGLPITLVGLDVTNSVRVTTERAADFKAHVVTPAARFWDAVLDKNDWFIESNEYYFWDTLAVIIAMHPEFCRGDELGLRVDYAVTDTPWMQTTDTTMPDTTVRDEQRRHLDAASAGVMQKDMGYPSVRVCRESFPEKVFVEFRDRLNNVTDSAE